MLPALYNASPFLFKSSHFCPQRLVDIPLVITSRSTPPSTRLHYPHLALSMPPRKTLDAFLDQGDQRSGHDGSGIINNEEVRKVLQSGTERNYKRAVALYGV